jgi:hypothetical protein
MGPTNTRGSRYKATAQWGSLTVSADDTQNVDGNHERACLMLREKIAKENAAKYGRPFYSDPWMRAMVSGQLPDGSYAHVFKE